ncbi:MAG: hypothetical protein Q8R76_05020 [Candidatus Omnitrophota bacterium]|nr:hypothetical protein [Candidatus Omnitrophota bacterium]
MSTKTKIANNITAAAISTLIFILFLEIAFRIFPSPARSEFLNHQFNIRHPSSQPTFGKHPTLGEWNIPGSQAVVKRREYEMTVGINTKGLRNPETPYEKSPSRYRILFLGDSFTYGTGVEEHQTFVAGVNKKIAAYGEAINGGAPGSSTADEFRFLQSEGIKYSPDSVVLCFFQNDIQDNFQKALDKTNHYNPSPFLSFFYRAFGRISQTLDHLFYGRSALYAFVVNFKRNFVIPYTITDTEFAATAEWLERIKGFTDSRGIQFAIIYIPRREEILKPEQFLTHTYLERYAASRTIPLLSLWRVFRTREDYGTLYFPLDTHLNSSGHAEVTRLIIDFLRSELKGFPG